MQNICVPIAHLVASVISTYLQASLWGLAPALSVVLALSVALKQILGPVHPWRALTDWLAQLVFAAYWLDWGLGTLLRL